MQVLFLLETSLLRYRNGSIEDELSREKTIFAMFTNHKIIRKTLMTTLANIVRVVNDSLFLKVPVGKDKYLQENKIRI